MKNLMFDQNGGRFKVVAKKDVAVKEIRTIKNKQDFPDGGLETPILLASPEI
jgi:hypothetical protein